MVQRFVFVMLALILARSEPALVFPAIVLTVILTFLSSRWKGYEQRKLIYRLQIAFGVSKELLMYPYYPFFDPGFKAQQQDISRVSETESLGG